MLFVEAKQNLDEMMMFDPHVKFAKSIGVKDTKIRHALMQQLEKHDRNFENRQEILNAIMDLNQEDKCMKCKSNLKNAVGMPCGHLLLDLFARHTRLLVIFTMMEQHQLLSQAMEMESAARDIRTQMKEIAASGLTIPSSTLLRKAIISVKNGKVMFCIVQLSKIVNLLMGNLPHILFGPKSDTKEYIILLFWSTNMDDSECEIQKKFEIIKQEIAIDHFQLRCIVENVPSPRRQFLYLINNYVCSKTQKSTTYRRTTRNN